jgi:glucokinase
MAKAAQPVLLADLGGTNARFALACEGELRQTARFLVADYLGPVEAIRDFLNEARPETKPRRAVLAFAGPVAQGWAQLTNGSWRVSASGLRRHLGMDSVSLVNDFAALAWALPELGARDVVTLGGGKAVRGAPAIVIGPGTGLGVAGHIPARHRAVVLSTEGGHVTMAPADSREGALLDHLRMRFGHVSAERVLSGPGLENLYQAIAAVDGTAAPLRPAPEIINEALTGDCPVSVAALGEFCAMLGTVAGNLALTFGARGGVFIAGGIVPRFVEFLAASAFRERFEAKGRFASYLAGVPVRVIVHPDPAFLGLAALAAEG